MDRQRQEQPQISFGDDNQKDRQRQMQPQIPFGDDNQKGQATARADALPFSLTSAEEADDEDCEDGDADGGVEAVAFDGKADDSEEHAGDGSGNQQEDA